jgi:glucokinase
MSVMAAIGVDIGGTATKAGLISLDGQVLARVESDTPHHLSTSALVSLITDLVCQLVDGAGARGLSPRGVGVSICGSVDGATGVPVYINLKALEGFPIADHLARLFGIPVVIDNDMNCGVLGEHRFGGARDVDRLMVMTVGTGIGMAVMLDGQVLRFHEGTVGNPGHLIMVEDGPLCAAGCHGCLESLTSAAPIARLAESAARSARSPFLRDALDAKGSVSPFDVFCAAEAGDEAAHEIWRKVGAYLGRGLASWVEIFGPEVVIVGGGVALAGHWILEPIERELRRVGEPRYIERVREVRQSRLGKDSAMLGAASLVLAPEHTPL